ncbi:flavodoxin family protein [Clostridium cylindrosporum]|uniref:NADPH-dependent FMN reductase n=1 Tax=Clostridium cylindrosporum DSM 605 TaxID=1121307 RepID=A0A0J8DA17_CLOCY|nr:flavodoxin family protein [Clostridium cylindrosporum]KMT22692.1 NADPH-dependent FMN reductase [Clostridium cylindrosporum DSM 605]
MKALIFTGNTRKHGKTEKLLKSFVDGLKDSGCSVEIIDAVKTRVSPCTGCLSCEKTGQCVIKDEMQEIYNKVEESDILVLASPVYFASVTAQLKTMIDRFQALFSRRYILKTNTETKRKGYLVFTAGLTNPKEIVAMEVLAKFFMLSCNSTLEEMIYAMNTDHEEIAEEKFKEAYEIGKKAGTK